jgi:hypothetical protein
MWCYNGVGIQPVSLEDPIVAMYPIQCDYNSREWVVLPFIFPVQKNLQLPVQVPMGSLTRPVTGYQTHYDPGYHEHGHDYEDDLHHVSVPLIPPSTSATAVAVMNRPAMMYVKSM